MGNQFFFHIHLRPQRQQRQEKFRRTHLPLPPPPPPPHNKPNNQPKALWWRQHSVWIHTTGGYTPMPFKRDMPPHQDRHVSIVINALSRVTFDGGSNTVEILSLYQSYHCMGLIPWYCGVMPIVDGRFMSDGVDRRTATTTATTTTTTTTIPN